MSVSKTPIYFVIYVENIRRRQDEEIYERHSDGAFGGGADRLGVDGLRG